MLICLFDPVFCLCCTVLRSSVSDCDVPFFASLCCVALYSVSGYVVLCFSMCLASGLGGLQHHG